MIKAFKVRLEHGMGPEFGERRAEMWLEVEKLIHESMNESKTEMLKATLLGCVVLGVFAVFARPFPGLRGAGTNDTVKQYSRVW